MDLEYIDHTHYGLTPRIVNRVLRTTDWDAFEAWYKKHQLPQGLQCVAMHYHPTIRDYAKALLVERSLPYDEITLLRVAIVIDSMIS